MAGLSVVVDEISSIALTRVDSRKRMHAYLITSAVFSETVVDRQACFLVSIDFKTIMACAHHVRVRVQFTLVRASAVVVVAVVL